MVLVAVVVLLWALMYTRGKRRKLKGRGILMFAPNIFRFHMKMFMLITCCVSFPEANIINVPTATNIACGTTHSPIATDTHETYVMIPASPSSIPTANNVAYAVPLQPDCSFLQPAATADCAT